GRPPAAPPRPTAVRRGEPPERGRAARSAPPLPPRAAPRRRRRRRGATRQEARRRSPRRPRGRTARQARSHPTPVAGARREYPARPTSASCRAGAALPDRDRPRGRASRGAALRAARSTWLGGLDPAVSPVAAGVDDVGLAGPGVAKDEEVVPDQLQLHDRLLRPERVEHELLRLDDHGRLPPGRSFGRGGRGPVRVALVLV